MVRSQQRLRAMVRAGVLPQRLVESPAVSDLRAGVGRELPDDQDHRDDGQRQNHQQLEVVDRG